MSDSVSMNVGTSSNILSMTVGSDIYLPTWSEVRNKPDNIVCDDYPTGGSTGNVLKKTADGMEWAAGGGGAVDSVNGQTGTVVLDNEDVGAAATSHTHAQSDVTGLADALAGKQATISDLDTIRSGASAGATALQAVPNTYRTSAAQDVIDSGKQDSISDLATIRSGAAAGATAYQKPAAGIPASDMASAVQTVIGSAITKITAEDGLVSNTSGGQTEIGLSSESQASLAKADTALQSVPNTYRTSAAQDVIDAGKVDKVTGMGLSYLKNAAVANDTLTITKQDDTTITFQGGGTDDGAVHYTADSGKTDAQKVQAVRNISIIKTAMDSVAVAGAQYYLGEQTAVTVTLPSTALAGQEIGLVFYSGATAATLSISGATIGSVDAPAANQRVEVSFLWDGKKWAILSSLSSLDSYTITATAVNCTGSASNPTKIGDCVTAALTFTAASGYTLPLAVSVTGATGSWSRATGTMILSEPTGAVSFTVTGVSE